MSAKTTRNRLDGYAEMIRRAMRDMHVPGCAIGIVHDGRTAFARGFGRRDVANTLPVTTDTLFAIGSCTKAFTCTALGILADEGKLDWDAPVRDYAPDFRMFDAVATERMTTRDLVTHRSGLPRHDMLWYGSQFTRAELFARLRHLEPSKDFRAAFQYNNLMYLAAGVVIEHITGRTWEQFIHERLLAPLGMARSNTSVTTSQADQNFAKPYHRQGDEISEVPFHSIDAMGPAGSINSSINDMIRWLKCNLNGGRHGSAQIISEGMLREIHSPHMVVGGAYLGAPEVGPPAYGLGWLVSTYRGHLMLQHSGGIDGFISLMTVLPNDGIGIVVLTNEDRSPLTQAATFSALDRLLGTKRKSWLGTMWAQQRKAEAEAAKAKDAQPGSPQTVALRPMQDYAGAYQHPGYGRAEFVAAEDADGSQLRLRYNSFDVPFRHVLGDAFAGSLDQLGLEFKVAFGSDLDGRVSTFTLVMDPSAKPVTFTRVAEAAHDRATLEKYAGRYELSGMIVTISVQGADALVADVPGQPRYALLPVAPARFTLKGLSGFSIEFRDFAAGPAKVAVFHQPNGDFSARRVAE